MLKSNELNYSAQDLLVHTEMLSVGKKILTRTSSRIVEILRLLDTNSLTRECSSIGRSKYCEFISKIDKACAVCDMRVVVNKAK